MKIIRHQNSSINVNSTLETLAMGESVSFSKEQARVDYIRCQASKVAKRNGWVLSVSNPAELKGKIIVTRNK